MFFCCGRGRKRSTREDFFEAASDFEVVSKRNGNASPSGSATWLATHSTAAAVSGAEVVDNGARSDSVSISKRSGRSPSRGSSDRVEEEEQQRWKPEGHTNLPSYSEAIKDTQNQEQVISRGNVSDVRDKFADLSMRESDYGGDLNEDDIRSQRPNWIDEVAGSQFQGSVVNARDTHSVSDTESIRPRWIRHEPQHPGGRMFSNRGDSVRPKRWNEQEPRLQRWMEEGLNSVTNPSTIPDPWWLSKQASIAESDISKPPGWISHAPPPSEFSQRPNWIEKGQAERTTPAHYPVVGEQALIPGAETGSSSHGPKVTRRVDSRANSPFVPGRRGRNDAGRIASHGDWNDKVSDVQPEQPPRWIDDTHSQRPGWIDADGGRSEAPDDRVYRLTTHETLAVTTAQDGQDSSPEKTMGGQSSSEGCPRPRSEVADSEADQRRHPSRKAKLATAAAAAASNTEKGHTCNDEKEAERSLPELIKRTNTNESLRRHNEKIQVRSPSPHRDRGSRHDSGRSTSPSPSQSTHENPAEGSPGKGAFESDSSRASRTIPSREKLPPAAVVRKAISSEIGVGGATKALDRSKPRRVLPNDPSPMKCAAAGSSLNTAAKAYAPIAVTGDCAFPLSPKNGGKVFKAVAKTDNVGVPKGSREGDLTVKKTGGGNRSGQRHRANPPGDKREKKSGPARLLHRGRVRPKPPGLQLHPSPSIDSAVDVDPTGSWQPPAPTRAGDRDPSSQRAGVVSAGGAIATGSSEVRDDSDTPCYRKGSPSPLKRARPPDFGEDANPIEPEEIRQANVGRKPKEGGRDPKENPHYSPGQPSTTTLSRPPAAAFMTVATDPRALRPAGSTESTSSPSSSESSPSKQGHRVRPKGTEGQKMNGPSGGNSVKGASLKTRPSRSPALAPSLMTGLCAQPTGVSTSGEREHQLGWIIRHAPSVHDPRPLSIADKYSLDPRYDIPSQGTQPPNVATISKPMRRRPPMLGTPSQRNNGRPLRPSPEAVLPSVEESPSGEDSGPSSPGKKSSNRPPALSTKIAIPSVESRNSDGDNGQVIPSATDDVSPSKIKNCVMKPEKGMASSSKPPSVPTHRVSQVDTSESPNQPVEADDGKQEAIAWLHGRRRQAPKLRDESKLSRRKSFSRSSSFDEGSMRSLQSKGVLMFSPERFNAGAGALSWGGGSHDDSWATGTATESVYSFNTRASSSRSISGALALSKSSKLVTRQTSSKREKVAIERLKINRSDVHFGYRPVRGSTSVYKAELKGEILAAKVISILHMSKDSVADVMDVFDAELLLLSQLKSPNIVKVFGASVSPAELILVSEFVDGGTLRDLLETPTQCPSLRPKSRLLIAHDVAAGMRSVYAHGMQHRRLTSYAVLLTHARRAKISGVGLLMTNEMVAYGSEEEPDPEMGLPWVSREVLAGAGFGQESDVYSFGIVLWEIMQGNGSLPYSGLSLEQVVSVKYRGQGPPITRNCPQEISRLMQSCWSNIPADRPSFDKICDVLDPSGMGLH